MNSPTNEFYIGYWYTKGWQQTKGAGPKQKMASYRH